MVSQLAASISQRLGEANKVVIASHVRPDGDAIGSLLALGQALMNAGKQVQMVLQDGVPAAFRFLENSELVQTVSDGEFDTFITLDCADFKRVGRAFEACVRPDLNIDHHVTNQKYGKMNLIVPEAVATAAILTDYLPQWGLEITKPIASALLSGIVTDTLGFRTSNMTSEALRQAAALMDIGADLPVLYHQALVSRTYPAARYWGAGLSNLRRNDGYGLVYGTLTLADREATGYQGNDDADLINIISAIEGSTVGMIFVEQADKRVKISWRALKPGIDVSQVAKHFGGGGHQAAAGADIPGKLSEIQPLVLKTTEEMLGL
ncbi:MAG: DHH family phosphoesterase [Anaerolineales bacterium]|nr:DHH family phosphoesterase [Anaerolineales bacterium]